MWAMASLKGEGRTTTAGTGDRDGDGGRRRPPHRGHHEPGQQARRPAVPGNGDGGRPRLPPRGHHEPGQQARRPAVPGNGNGERRRLPHRGHHEPGQQARRPALPGNDPPAFRGLRPRLATGRPFGANDPHPLTHLPSVVTPWHPALGGYLDAARRFCYPAGSTSLAGPLRPGCRPTRGRSRRAALSQRAGGRCEVRRQRPPKVAPGDPEERRCSRPVDRGVSRPLPRCEGGLASARQAGWYREGLCNGLSSQRVGERRFRFRRGLRAPSPFRACGSPEPRRSGCRSPLLKEGGPGGNGLSPVILVVAVCRRGSAHQSRRRPAQT